MMLELLKEFMFIFLRRIAKQKLKYPLIELWMSFSIYVFFFLVHLY